MLQIRLFRRVPARHFLLRVLSAEKRLLCFFDGGLDGLDCERIDYSEFDGEMMKVHSVVIMIKCKMILELAIHVYEEFC